MARFEPLQRQAPSTGPRPGLDPRPAPSARAAAARGPRLGSALLVLGLGLGSTTPAHASRADLGGYLRIGTRPDFQGGSGTLGYWNLYGRLLNEGPYAAVELKIDVLEPQSGLPAPTASLHLKVEGGSIATAATDGGSLANFRMSQLYTRAGNVLLPEVTWQVGTLDTYLGDLGLYDMRPAQIFLETVGLSGRWQRERFELLLGLGDSGYALRGDEYSTILTAGGTARIRIGDHLELGTGGMFRHEPSVPGNRYAPLYTPGIDYADFLRGEIVSRYLQENPNRELEFPDPVATSSSSAKVIGYLGFGGLGGLRWNNTFASWERRHPATNVLETVDGQDYTIYIHDLTDERTVLTVGNELQLRVVPDRLDLVWAALWGHHQDLDNTLAPSDHARQYASTVLRLQAYFTETVHWLGESSIAREHSTNGNAYREHADSIFANTEGLPDTEGFELGDTDTRITWQGKTGLVLNPLGMGVYTRPSLRLLYGVQVSNQNNAFGNSFVDTIDQYNEFDNIEQHVHHVISLETEAWF